MAEVVEQGEDTSKMMGRRGEKRPHREPHRREADRRRLAEMLLTHEKSSTRQLAQVLGLSASTIRRDLQALRAEWQRERARDFDDWIAQQLQEINLGLKEAWRGWHDSRLPNRQTKSKSKGFVKKPPAGQKRVSPRAEDMLEFEQGMVERTSSGDPRFIELIAQLLGARAKLLGLDRPQKVAFTDPLGEEAYADPRERLLAALERHSQHMAVPLPAGIVGAGEQPTLAPAPVEVVEQPDGSFSVDHTGESGSITPEVFEVFKRR
jgi:hypothetical protein